MRRCALILAAGLAGLAGAPSAVAVPLRFVPQTRVRVTPRVGGRRTHFHFALRLPSATQSGLQGVHDTLSVAGPKRAGCLAATSTSLPAGAAGARVSVSLGPAAHRGRWCAGRFHGYVLETIRTVCSRTLLDLCPQLVIAPRVIARFSFRVR